jgi:peptidyl-prolyl cis-trans isomerase SurA
VRKLKTFLITFALSAVLCVPVPALAGIMLDRVVAVVNDEAITWGELYRAMEFEFSRDKRSLSVEQKKAIFEENNALFLENMINTKLQLQEARKYNIGVSDMEIDAIIENIKLKYGLDSAGFIKVLQADGFIIEDYRERLAEQITIGKLVDFAVKSEIVITEEELKEIPEGDAFYSIRQIFLKESADARERADAIVAELEAGADFAEFARKYSESPLASVSGDFGYVQKSKMAKEFASVVEVLKPGEVSKPFKNEKGIHILKVEDIKSVRDMLAEERLAEAYANWLRSLREKAFIEIRL